MPKALISFLTITFILTGANLALAQDYNPNYSWWFPTNNSTIGPEVDFLFNLIMWVVCGGFILTNIVLVYFLIRYKAKPGEKAVYSHGNNTAEVIWTVVPTLLMIILFIMSDAVWSDIKMNNNVENAEVIEIQGQQFQWYFRYPGPDGKFGEINYKLISGSNPMGINYGSEAGSDDSYTDILYIPVGRPVELRMTSKDVIHSFFLPEYRMKTDVMPGSEHKMVFTALLPAETEIACAELCGLAHYRMRGFIKALPAAEYDAWKANLYAETAAANEE